MAFRHIWYTGYPALTDIPTVQTLVKVTVIKAHWGPGDGLDRRSGVGIKAGPARFLACTGGWQRHSLRPEHWQRVWLRGNSDMLKWSGLGDISGEMLRDKNHVGLQFKKQICPEGHVGWQLKPEMLVNE